MVETVSTLSEKQAARRIVNCRCEGIPDIPRRNVPCCGFNPEPGVQLPPVSLSPCPETGIRRTAGRAAGEEIALYPDGALPAGDRRHSGTTVIPVQSVR